MKYFLGVDGGQSGTTAVIGDETGRILGTGEAGPCNHAAAAEGRAKFDRAIRGSVGEACRAAGLDFETVEFEVACFGLSGGPEHRDEVLAGIIRSPRPLILTTDAAVALAGATPEGQGIIVIAGTGSISMGRNAAGRTARAGGWGYIFGDEGGAFDIGRQALRAALRMEEGWGPPTRLHEILVEATGSRNANDMLHRFYGPDWPRSRVATLAPLVDTAAAAGDPVAARIVQNAAQDLALLAASVRGQLWSANDPVTVAHIGGVFQSAQLMERFRALIELDGVTQSRSPLFGPAEGALAESYSAFNNEYYVNFWRRNKKGPSPR
jgi:N-acetylglucosamine kinase-like BadF-type ATPase